MNLKEFFKPDWKKIVIFLIVFIFLPVFPLYTKIYCLVGPCPPLLEYKSLIELFFLGMNKFIYYFEDLGRILRNVPFHLITLIFGLFISYIISCLIIWIYDKKFRKVKKK